MASLDNPTKRKLEVLLGITVAKDVGVLSADVAEHAGQVRNFRNYIHPRLHLKESFAPHIETARIAQQVLVGALKDLESQYTKKGKA
ncbi:hypothetical protein [Rhodococcus aetherivorans]|uniref:hypothetical protein n=1 Tax=Rhodococcus aetherivorans TaxID=191292 RepID=UPI0029497631|nr:hypothetical protein [Rhodococcus aetherivorans]MDV6291473.1 hypothetical protein [Rhodococcus aetherivorans]